MSYVAFWLNIFAFTFMFGAFGLSYILYRKEKASYRLYYLWYIGISWVWFVAQFALFVQFNIINNQSEQLLLIVGMIRTLFSIGIFFITPLMLVQIGCGRISKKSRNLVFFSTTFLVIFITIIIVFQLQLIATIFSISMNTLLGVAFLTTRYYLFRTKHEHKVSSMIPFLWISGITFILFGFYGFLFNALPSLTEMDHMVYDSFFTGLFITVWCLNDLLVFLGELTQSFFSSADSIPQKFIQVYGISPREQDIILELMKGSSYKEMGNSLCISTRTVETHVYRIFKKCEVSNKVELMNLVRTYT